MIPVEEQFSNAIYKVERTKEWDNSNGKTKYKIQLILKPSISWLVKIINLNKIISSELLQVKFHKITNKYL